MKGQGVGIPNLVKAATENFAGREFTRKAGLQNFNTSTEICLFSTLTLWYSHNVEWHCA
jgi:hypothetical protein